MVVVEDRCAVGSEVLGRHVGEEAGVVRFGDGAIGEQAAQRHHVDVALAVAPMPDGFGVVLRSVRQRPPSAVIDDGGAPDAGGAIRFALQGRDASHRLATARLQRNRCRAPSRDDLCVVERGEAQAGKLLDTIQQPRLGAHGPGRRIVQSNGEQQRVAARHPRP